MGKFFKHAFKHPKTTWFGLLAGIAQLATAMAVSPGRVGVISGAVGGALTAILGAVAADAKAPGEGGSK